MAGRGNTYAEHSGHGRNVQTEEASADTCEGAHDVLGVCVRWTRARMRVDAHTGLPAINVLYCRHRGGSREQWSGDGYNAEMAYPFTHVREQCLRARRLEGWVVRGLEPVRREEAGRPLYANTVGPLLHVEKLFCAIF